TAPARVAAANPAQTARDDERPGQADDAPVPSPHPAAVVPAAARRPQAPPPPPPVAPRSPSHGGAVATVGSGTGELGVQSEDGAVVMLEGTAMRATARARRSGELPRATFNVAPGEYRIRCEIPGESDPVRVRERVRVVADEENHARCFR